MPRDMDMREKNCRVDKVIEDDPSSSTIHAINDGGDDFSVLEIGLIFIFFILFFSLWTRTHFHHFLFSSNLKLLLRGSTDEKIKKENKKRRGQSWGLLLPKLKLRTELKKEEEKQMENDYFVFSFCSETCPCPSFLLTKPFMSHATIEGNYTTWSVVLHKGQDFVPAAKRLQLSPWNFH
ncbi:hypothetical protein CKAN_00696000 [Cinnamomum micranthum f. kanehirae]|uniref:Uncharacterized protein n=1 Tax=Cinnamomum micranthum f. kanehirae TaxID=337451 RepID=A0A443NIU0_9MAGN|nr:hypothetical protein CKAN_00696000 [Cinnamomum micranthum f. kanehirae]